MTERETKENDLEKVRAEDRRTGEVKEEERNVKNG